MIRPANEGIEVWLCVEPVDFRKQITGLATLVQDSLAMDPFSTQLFVFTNRRRTQCRILYWRCCVADYVAAITVPVAKERWSPNHRNIIFPIHNDFRKAISPLFFFHGRLDPRSPASQSATALAFISRSISA